MSLAYSHEVITTSLRKKEKWKVKNCVAESLMSEHVSVIGLVADNVQLRLKGKDKRERPVLDIALGAAYTSQTRDQKRFTISEVAADCHELMLPRRIMRIHCPRQRTSGPAVQLIDMPPPRSATLSLHPVARNPLLISHSAAGRRLS